MQINTKYTIGQKVYKVVERFHRGEFSIVKKSGDERYQTVQLITQQQQNFITRRVSMLSEEH